ncbi:hypothetical protein Hypma_000401, partial [Hypsizygus marmoreus]
KRNRSGATSPNSIYRTSQPSQDRKPSPRATSQDTREVTARPSAASRHYRHQSHRHHCHHHRHHHHCTQPSNSQTPATTTWQKKKL